MRLPTTVPQKKIKAARNVRGEIRRTYGENEPGDEVKKEIAAKYGLEWDEYIAVVRYMAASKIPC